MKIDVDSSIDDNQISFYAEDIERSLDAFLPFAANSNTYVQKAMTLIFNLKQNGVSQFYLQSFDRICSHIVSFFVFDVRLIVFPFCSAS